MKWAEFLSVVREVQVFSVSVLLAGQASPAGVRRQIDRWVRSGKLIMLRRGVYRVASPYAHGLPHPFAVANRLRRSSYVSLQSALAYYGMIPEHTPATTSITTSRPEELDTPDGRYLFRHVKTALFFGYVEREVAPGQPAVIATPEKALLDLFSLTPESDSLRYLAELRVEPSSAFDNALFADMAMRVGSAKVLRAVKRTIALLRHEKEDVTL
jgi:predicted transcriptional regulator of viral defense system